MNLELTPPDVSYTFLRPELTLVVGHQQMALLQSIAERIEMRRSFIESLPKRKKEVEESRGYGVTTWEIKEHVKGMTSKSLSILRHRGFLKCDHRPEKTTNIRLQLTTLGEDVINRKLKVVSSGSPSHCIQAAKDFDKRLLAKMEE